MFKQKIKIIFIGTPDFATPILRKLAEDEQFKIIAAITRPDKKTGRKRIITPPAVKIEAQKLNIPIYQPEQISDLSFNSAPKLFSSSGPDIIIVAAYAQLLPSTILELPQYGCINVHASLLPKYRGASPIQAAILNGDKRTGVTIMKMDAGLDTGQILAQKSVVINHTDTAGVLFKKLSKLGAELLPPTVKKYIAGSIIPRPQNENLASYAKILTKKNGRINWRKEAAKIERQIRAMNPWPVAFTLIKKQPDKTRSPQRKKNDRTLKIWLTRFEPAKINQYKIGELFLYRNKIAVQCGQNALIIEKLQPAGKKIMTAEEFARGYNKLGGIILQ